jgi:hypothetical protein
MRWEARQCDECRHFSNEIREPGFPDWERHQGQDLCPQCAYTLLHAPVSCVECGRVICHAGQVTPGWEPRCLEHARTEAEAA